MPFEALENDFERTVIIVHRPTEPGQDLVKQKGIRQKSVLITNVSKVLRGANAGCPHLCEECDCGVDIRLAQADGKKWPEYEAWKQGDEHLNWSRDINQNGRIRVRMNLHIQALNEQILRIPRPLARLFGGQQTMVGIPIMTHLTILDTIIGLLTWK